MGSGQDPVGLNVGRKEPRDSHTWLLLEGTARGED